MLISTPRSLSEAKNLIDYTDGFLVGLNGFTRKHLNNFSITEVYEVIKLNKLVILRLDNMLYDEEIKKYQELVDLFKPTEVLFYVTDLGLVTLLSDNGLINRCIYDSQTMVTNKMDAKFYLDLGLNAVGISSEIPFKDVLESHPSGLFYLVFGLRMMFTSRRRVVSLYLEHANLKSSLESLSLVEATRTERYPLFEDESGTAIYRSYFVSLIKELKDSKLKYMLLDSLLVEEDKYLMLNKIYYKYLNGKISLDDSLDLIASLNLNIEDGFTFKDSVYQKEEF